MAAPTPSLDDTFSQLVADPWESLGGNVDGKEPSHPSVLGHLIRQLRPGQVSRGLGGKAPARPYRLNTAAWRRQAVCVGVWGGTERDTDVCVPGAVSRLWAAEGRRLCHMPLPSAHSQCRAAVAAAAAATAAAASTAGCTPTPLRTRVRGVCAHCHSLSDRLCACVPLCLCVCAVTGPHAGADSGVFPGAPVAAGENGTRVLDFAARRPVLCLLCCLCRFFSRHLLPSMCGYVGFWLG